MLKNTWLGVVLVGALAWLSWWAWMGWDTEMSIDPVTGNQSGPYEAWQVIGSALCVVALVVVATLVWGTGVAVLATTVGYTAGWVVTAFAEDEQGLAVIGAGLVLVGIAVGSAVIAAITDQVAARRAR